MCTGFLFLPSIIFWPSFAEAGHHSREQLLTWAPHQALGFCLSQTLYFGDTYFIGDVSMQSSVKKGASQQSTCAPVHSPHMARFKRGWIFSEIAKLLKMQYLMWMHSRQFVQPLLQERTFLAWHSQPACGLGKVWKFWNGGKRQRGRIGEHRAVEVLVKKFSRQCKWSKRFTTFLQSRHKSIFCPF